MSGEVTSPSSKFDTSNLPRRGTVPVETTDGFNGGGATFEEEEIDGAFKDVVDP